MTPVLTVPLLLAAAAAAPSHAPLGAALGAPETAPTSTVLQASEFVRLKGVAAKDQLAGLEELVEFCHSNKAYQERDKAYAAILVLDPEHEEARKWLRYKKDRRTGKWVQRGYREPKASKDEEIIEQAREKRLDIDAVYVDTVMDLVEEFEEALGPQKTKAEYAELMELAPDNERVREANGYLPIEIGGERVWKKKVVVEALKARDEINEQLDGYREEVPEYEEAEISDVEDALDIDWEVALRTDRFRVLGVASTSEVEDMLGFLHAQWDLLPDLMVEKPRLPRDFTFYTLDGESAKEAFIDNHPGLEGQDPDEIASLASTWLATGDGVTAWASEDISRIDVACKQLTNYYMQRSFGVGSDHGWILEGFSMYVNMQVCETRLSYLVVKTEYVDKRERDAADRFQDADADWIDLAAEILADAPPTRLVDTLGKNPNDLSPTDYVLSYALASYLIEAHGRRTVQSVLRKIGVEKLGSTVVLEQELGMTLPELQEELRGWVEQVETDRY